MTKFHKYWNAFLLLALVVVPVFVHLEWERVGCTGFANLVGCCFAAIFILLLLILTNHD